MSTSKKAPRLIARDPDGVSITGSRKARKSGMMPFPLIDKGNSKLETFEQSPERLGPDSVGVDTLGISLPLLDKDKPE